MKKIIFSLVFLLLLPSIFAIRHYGMGRYDFGKYGTNTEPEIDEYLPLDLTLNYNIDTNGSFFVTSHDDDDDWLNHTWYVNSTYNVSNQNFSMIFDNNGIFNVTINVSDNASDAYVSWVVTITTPEPAPSGGGGGGGLVCDDDEFLYYDECLPMYLFNIAQLVNKTVFEMFKEEVVLEYRLDTVTEAPAGGRIAIDNIIMNEGLKPVEINCINFFDKNLDAVHNRNEPSTRFSKEIDPDKLTVTKTRLRVPFNLNGTYIIVGRCELLNAISPNATAGATIFITESELDQDEFLMVLFVTTFFVGILLALFFYSRVKKKK